MTSDHFRCAKLAGEGAYGDPLLWTKYARFASDGTRLYVADARDGKGWIKAITAATPRTLSSPATKPEMEAAEVVPLTSPGALNSPWGIAAIGDGTFTTNGNQIVRVDGVTGATTEIAGAVSENGCVDADTGADARFKGPVVLATDDTFVYISDACGQLRRVNPTNGVTSSITVGGSINGISVVGRYLWVQNPTGAGMSRLFRHDLTTGAQTTMGDWGGRFTADENYVWTVAGLDLYRINADSGQGILFKTLPFFIDGISPQPATTSTRPGAPVSCGSERPTAVSPTYTRPVASRTSPGSPRSGTASPWLTGRWARSSTSRR